MGLCESKENDHNIDYERLKRYVSEFVEIYCEKDHKFSCMLSRQEL